MRLKSQTEDSGRYHAEERTHLARRQRESVKGDAARDMAQGTTNPYRCSDGARAAWPESQALQTPGHIVSPSS